MRNTHGQITWPHQLFEKLDRILMTIECEKIHLATVQVLTREIFDHTPLLLNLGESHQQHGHNLCLNFEQGDC
jgi:hypothetical protein